MKCNINLCVGGRPPMKNAPKIDESIKEVPPEEEKLAEPSTSSNFLHPNAGLDIIVEETSDLSDIEANKKPIPKPLRKKKRSNILQRIFHSNKQEPTQCVLVDAKIMQSLSQPEESRSVCKTETLDSEMEVEVVNLETISNASDEEDEDDVIDSNDIPSVIPLVDDNNNNNHVEEKEISCSLTENVASFEETEHSLEENVHSVEENVNSFKEMKHYSEENDHSLEENVDSVEESKYYLEESIISFEENSQPLEKDKENEQISETSQALEENCQPIEKELHSLEENSLSLEENVQYLLDNVQLFDENEDYMKNSANFPLENSSSLEENENFLRENATFLEKYEHYLRQSVNSLGENVFATEENVRPLEENALVKNSSSDSNQTFIYIDDIDDDDNIDEYSDDDYLRENIEVSEENAEESREKEEKVLLINNISNDQQQKQHANDDLDGKCEQSQSGTEENLVENRGEHCVECNKMKDQRENAENSQANKTATIELVPKTVENRKMISENSVLYKYLKEIEEDDLDIDSDDDDDQNNNNNNAIMSTLGVNNNNKITEVIYAKVEQNEKCDENVKIEPNKNENVENDEIIRTEFGRIEDEIEKLQEDLRLLGLQHEVVKEITYKISKQSDFIELQPEKSIDERRIPQELEKVSINLNPIPPKAENLSIDNVTYTEWQKKIEERQERKQQKVIKITQTGSNKIKNNGNNYNNDDNMSDEFIRKVKERRRKYKVPGDPDYDELGIRPIPKHLTEFLEFSESKSEESESQEEQNKNVPFKVVIVDKDNKPVKRQRETSEKGGESSSPSTSPASVIGVICAVGVIVWSICRFVNYFKK